MTPRTEHREAAERILRLANDPIASRGAAETIASACDVENVELRKDKARLDWLCAFKTGNFETPYWKIWANGNETLRQAIDAAIEASK